ncbi:mas-related G-protein coupled receptor member A8-like [Melospiza georgiana]|uniref:mas-related G-protein coupled receptor member A8-like n=1 Tax=Melospiza georgiana TaxID=44398 RepID=UPI0025AD333B|nr:mas-related G-protein coupled receptor member A8-like [Melospiza georgiana]
MEVTTVSPPPASPTEGDDLCETDVTSVALHSVTLPISLCGLAGNGAVLWLLGSCTSSRNSTILYVLMLSLLDFFFLLIMLPSILLFLLEEVSCSIIMPLSHIRFHIWTSLLSHSLWLYTLTFISIKRGRSIHCPLWLCCHRSQHLLKVMLFLLRAFFLTLVIVFAMMLSLCMFHQSEACWMSLSSIRTFNLLLCAPFLLISRTILFTHFKPGSQQQQPKKLDIVICLILLFTLPLSLCNFLQYLTYTIVPSHLFFLLACIHSTIKPFIYILVGRCWTPCTVGSLRLSLQRVFEEPEENTAHSHNPAMGTVL